jgi:anti-anti-sigma factor
MTQQAKYLWRTEKMGWTWLTVPDEITMDNYRVMEDDLIAVLLEGGHRIALDMTHVRYLYSSAMGLLIRAQKRAQESGTVFVLVNVAYRVRDVLSSVNLDKLLTLYATDVEFEVAQGEVWEARALGSDQDRFLSIARLEEGVCRVNLSGFMTGANDLSVFDETLVSQDISWYVFDLTGLEMIDSFGLSLLRKVLVKIRDKGGSSVAYGATEAVVPLFHFMSLDEFVTLYENERDALEAIGKA